MHIPKGDVCSVGCPEVILRKGHSSCTGFCEYFSVWSAAEWNDPGNAHFPTQTNESECWSGSFDSIECAGAYDRKSIHEEGENENAERKDK